MAGKFSISASLALVLVFCSFAQAQTYSESRAYDAISSLLISNSVNTNNQGQCASTSLVNSFQYLQNIAPGTYGTSLTGGAGTANAITSRNQLDNNIVTGGSMGDQGDTWNAKINWFASHGGTAGSTFAGVSVNSSTQANYQVDTGDMSFNQSGTQIWNFIVSQIQQGEDVEVGMFDHMVTVMGVSMSGSNMYAEIIDPNYPSPGGTGQGGFANGPVGEWVSATYNSAFFGLIQLSGFAIGGTGYNTPDIFYAFAESPKNVPEPATIALLLGGGAGLFGAFRWRRRCRTP